MNELKKETYYIGNGHWNYNNKGNVIINSYNGLKELIFYKNEFIVPTDCIVNKQIDKSRKFFYNTSGCLEPKKHLDNLIELLQKSLFNSRKRSIDNLYGYCLSNDWNYFITLTFSNEINRFDLDAVNYAWQKFKQKMQYYFKDIKMILIPEGHPTSGAIHFHGLIGGADFDKYLVKAINNDKTSPYYGQLLKTKFGYQIYNFVNTFYVYGFSTVVKIDKETPKKRIVNYLIKYISKELNNTKKSIATNVRYNKKSYYHTRNLIAKEKQVCYFSKNDLESLLEENLLQQVIKVKENEKFIVYELKGEQIN